MKTKKNIAITFSIILGIVFNSCVRNPDTTTICERTAARELIFGIAYKIHMEEENKLSEAEIRLHRQLEDIFFEYVVVENNRFMLTISREEFKKKGLPVVFYDLFEEDLANTNYGITKYPFNEVDWDEAHRKSREEFLERRRMEDMQQSRINLFRSFENM